MELNFGYDISYCMFRLVTKIDMSLMCIYFHYDLCKLYARLNLMLFIELLINFSLSTSAPRALSLLIVPLVG
jgi:hypothetical protein